MTKTMITFAYQLGYGRGLLHWDRDGIADVLALTWLRLVTVRFWHLVGCSINYGREGE